MKFAFWKNLVKKVQSSLMLLTLRILIFPIQFDMDFSAFFLVFFKNSTSELSEILLMLPISNAI